MGPFCFILLVTVDRSLFKARNTPYLLWLYFLLDSILFFRFSFLVSFMGLFFSAHCLNSYILQGCFISSGFFLLSTLTRLPELHSWFQLSLTCCIFSLHFPLELKTRKSSWFLEISLTCFIGSLNSMRFKNDLVIFTSNLFLNYILFKWMVWKFPHLWKLETK